LNAAKAKGYAEGTKDRAGGYMQNVAGAVTGDKEQQARGKTIDVLSGGHTQYD